MSKLKEYAAIVGSILLAIVTFGLYARNKGEQAMQSKVSEANDREATAQATNAQLESRHATDVEVQKLPDAPIQTVGTADPSTSAGHLRDDGWIRD